MNVVGVMLAKMVMLMRVTEVLPESGSGGRGGWGCSSYC